MLVPIRESKPVAREISSARARWAKSLPWQSTGSGLLRRKTPFVGHLIARNIGHGPRSKSDDLIREYSARFGRGDRRRTRSRQAHQYRRRLGARGGGTTAIFTIGGEVTPLVEPLRELETERQRLDPRGQGTRSTAA